MAVYTAERIKKRAFNVTNINPINARERFIIGFDSEADTTSDGRPMLFQFSLPEQKEEDTILEIVPPEPNAGLRVFLDFITKYCINRDYEYLIYVWNLTYELTQIFHDIPNYIKKTSDFHIKDVVTNGTRYPWSISVLNFKRQMVEFRNNRISVNLLDGTGFYKVSLDVGAKMLGIGEKYALSGLSRSTFTRDDLSDPEFIRYAKRDAYVTRLIGEYIQDQHRLYSIPTTISAPHFAATVFKTQFLSGGFTTPNPTLEQAGLSSYHGGKNGFYLERPTEFPFIYQYDITSAYPEAMKQLPNIETGSWRKTTKYVAGQHALYCVTLDYYQCTYRGMQNHDGSWTKSGIVEDTWITGYELDEILRNGEARVIRCYGYIYSGESGGALSDYVDKFFQLKRYASGPERETAKLLLNSLYGKFFQKQPFGAIGNYDFDNERWIVNDPTLDYDYEAGGLYHPPFASLITGFVRAKIHRLEHKYESVMTSTDGLFGTNPPDSNDLGKDLGQLTVSSGRLRIWRERLYIFDPEGSNRKFALHGFHGKSADLEQIPLVPGEYRYYGQQMITLKQSTKRINGVNYSAGQFVKLPFILKI